MSEKTLLIELFQPFAQYRNPFTFYYAQTYPLPPKSTIIGMLQNAVGDWYGNKDEENGVEKWWNLKVSVHGGFESIFWNYQNLIKGELRFTQDGRWINRHDKNLGGNVWLPLYGSGLTSQRSPVYQQELFNGHLMIFVRGDAGLINKIEKALKGPPKILYLGRSEDIIFIKKTNEISAVEIVRNVEGDIKLTKPTYIKLDGFPIKNQKYPVYSIPVKVLFKNLSKTGLNNVKHKAEINKNTKRQVEFTTVIYTGNEYRIILKDNCPVSVEVYDFDGKEIKILEHGWI